MFLCMDTDPVSGARCERSKDHDGAHANRLRVWPRRVDGRAEWVRRADEHRLVAKDYSGSAA